MINIVKLVLILMIVTKLITIGPFLRATIFTDFMDFSDFHEICFTENYRKSYYDMDCILKRNVDS